MTQQRNGPAHKGEAGIDLLAGGDLPPHSGFLPKAQRQALIGPSILARHFYRDEPLFEEAA